MSTEREKQMHAVEDCISDYEKAAGNIHDLRVICASKIIDALAPWLTPWLDGPVMTEREKESVKSFNHYLADIHTRLTKLEAGGMDAKSPPKPLTDRYSVSIMRAKGSKWHAVVNDIDWVAAIEYADRWYGDPEIQAVEVCRETDNPNTEQVIYLKRKP